jgi:hypothetical protein
MIRKLLILLALMLPATARAEWREARSNHFIVYSEGSERQLRDFTEKLEKFHFILRTMHNVTRDPSPIKLRVYLMRNIDHVGRTFPGGGGGVAGYYIHRTRGPIMVGTRGSGGQYSYGVDPETILLHEYAHHFMYEYFPATYPTWYSEGFAEFWGATQIGANDVVEVGHAAADRLTSFQGNRWVSIDRLLAARNYGDARGNIDLLYAQGWLLVRYLFENRERSGQLQTYLNAINAGRSYEDAMNEAFGEDARSLNNELRNFSGTRNFRVMRLPFRPIETGPIETRTVRPAEDALMMQEIRLGQGVTARDAPAFAAEVRRIAERFPDDPHALRMLAEAERLAGNTAAATAAPDALLRVAPRDARGLALRGLVRADALRAAENGDEAAWEATREPILAANRLDPNDPFILEAYYETFSAQGVLPPAHAQNALFRALELAPGDRRLRYRVASDFEQRDMIDEAIATIRPTALAQRDIGDENERERRRREEQEERYREAGQRQRESARRMLTRLERKRDGEWTEGEDALDPEAEVAE